MQEDQRTERTVQQLRCSVQSLEDVKQAKSSPRLCNQANMPEMDLSLSQGEPQAITVKSEQELQSVEEGGAANQNGSCFPSNTKARSEQRKVPYKFLPSSLKISGLL